MIVQPGGLGGVDPGLGAEPLARQGAARDQAAAARGRRQRVEGDALRRRVLDRLQRGGALPGDDQRIVERPHQGGAALRHQPVGDALAALGMAVVEHDLGAVTPGVLDLDVRGVGRHDDDGLDAEELGRAGDALGMVAGGERHNAALALGLAHRREPVEGAAELERTGALQALRLDEEAIAETVAQPWRFQQGGVDRAAPEPGGGGADIRKTGQFRRQFSCFHRQNRVSCPCEAYPRAIYNPGAASRRAKFSHWGLAGRH